MSDLATGEQSFKIKLEKHVFFFAWKITTSNIDARKFEGTVILEEKVNFTALRM